MISFAIAQFKKSVVRFSLDDVESDSIVVVFGRPPSVVDVISTADGEIDGHRRLMWCDDGWNCRRNACGDVG